MRRIWRLPSHSVVVATAVLILVGAGAALAAEQPQGKVAASATTTAKKAAKKYSKAYSLKYSKRFATPGPAGPAGPTGAQGPKGDKGEPGTNGTNGTNGFGTLQMVRHQCTDNLNGTQTSCTVSCPPGLFAAGGGAVGEGGFVDRQQVNGTRPNPNDAAPTGWTGFVNNELGGTNTTITMYVVCVNANDTGFSVNPDGSARGGK